MHALLLLHINQHMWFEVSSFTNSNDMTRDKNLNKKLSYHRGTAWCAMLVNLCSVSWCMGVIKVSNSKVTLKVIQGHRQWCHSIGHVWCLITGSLPSQLCCYLAPLMRYYHVSQKVRRSHDSEHIPYRGNRSRMH